MNLRKFAAVGAALLLAAGASACEIKFPSAATATPEAAIAADTAVQGETSEAAETSAAISDDAQETEPPKAETTANTAAETSGGDPGKGAYIEITVSEDKYFYENHEISADELLSLFDGLDSGTVVRISDENAAKKAYEAVTEALEERGILYENA